MANPEEMPDTIPLADPIVAIDGDAELHAPPATVLLNIVASPAHK